MARPGLILDRDGTIIEERGYIAALDDIVPLPGVEEALARARAAGIPIVVVTNQSAVARGIVTEEQLAVLHERVMSFGADAVYHCPHVAEDGCACRKPLPGLVQLAVRDFDLDPAHSLFVGDHFTDCLAGRAAGVEAVLVRTGHGREHEPEAIAAGVAVVDDLPTAIVQFLERIGVPR